MSRIRITCLLLSLVLMLGIVAGCSTPQTQTTAPSQTTASTASGTESSATTAETDKYAPVEGKTYSFTIAPYQRGPVDADAKLVSFFEERYGVEVEIWSLDPQNYDELLSIRFASNEIPDVFRAERQLKTWVEQGVLMEIDEEALRNHSPLAYNGSIGLSPNVFRLGRVNGKLYALAEVPTDAYRYRASIIRGDWLEAVGIEKPPVTLAEYEAMFYKFAQEDPDGNGTDDTYGVSDSGFPFVFGAFGLGSYNERIWIEQDGKVVYTPILPESKEVIKLLAKWYADGVVDPEFITGENTGGYWALSHAFINGRIGFTGHGGNGHWRPALREGDTPGPAWLELQGANPKAAETLIHSAPITGPDGKSGSFLGGQSNPVLGNVIHCFGVHLEEEPDKFGKWLEIMDDFVYGNEDNYNTHRYGIKGEDWDYNEFGGIKPLGTAAEDANYINKIGGFRNFAFYGPEIFPNAVHVDAAMNTWLEESHYTKGILKQGRLTSIKTETEIKLNADLDKIVDEAYIDMITGEKPIDYFDEFVDLWRRTGGAKVEEELNAWYTEFWGS